MTGTTLAGHRGAQTVHIEGVSPRVNTWKSMHMNEVYHSGGCHRGPLEPGINHRPASNRLQNQKEIMDTIILRVKNMVCPRCIKVVREELQKLGLEVVHIQLGTVSVKSNTETFKWQYVKSTLEKEGFELLEDKQAMLAEAIKSVIIEFIYSGTIKENYNNLSDYISQTLGKDYHSLSTAFSAVEKMTIEKYFILQRVERVKELLSYQEFNLSEIARKLGYSSISHLSGQFKSIVGISPTQFKKDGGNNRKSIDSVQ
jgi:AraC-like DNA-binding protein